VRVLITRPLKDAEPLAARLQALGHTTLVEPLINIVFADGPEVDLTGVQALLFTSANGARAAARRTPARNVPVLAVGPATAAAARGLGFANVTESRGEGVEGLAATISATRDPKAGALLHVTGSVTAGDLKASLAPQGFTVRVERLYEARTAPNLSGALAAELEGGLIEAALFFSPRTADLFVALIRAANLETACAKMRALALSPAVAKALSPLPFRAIETAAHTTADALLARLPPV
jgi:uroporphyrinogen-III synthase